jgi:hypothetical protein
MTEHQTERQKDRKTGCKDVSAEVQKRGRSYLTRERKGWEGRMAEGKGLNGGKTRRRV